MSQQDFTDLRPRVVMGIVAHPDDLDYGAAGTMAKFAKDGALVHYLIITDGSKGSTDENMTTHKLIKIRETEQVAALKRLGGEQVHFLGYTDGELEVTMELKRQLVKYIRQIRPDVVVTMDPSMLYVSEMGFINHPDHRAAGQATLDAVFPLARDFLSFPELYADGLKPHTTPTVLLINFVNHNYTIDITNTFDKKLAALKEHDSQIANFEEAKAWVSEMAERVGATCGCSKAEAFTRIDIR